MFTYHITVQNGTDFSAANVANIDKTVWLDNYRPESNAKLLYDASREIFAIRLTCEEKNPLVRYHNFYDPVYTDSCMEWFCCFDTADGRYINFEMNAGGALLAGFGPERANRTRISEFLSPEEIPVPKAEIFEDHWTVTLEVKKSILEKIYGHPLTFTPGTVLRGNFYKCGDQTPIEHYVMWNPVEVEKPDYHVPAFFGTFLLVD